MSYLRGSPSDSVENGIVVLPTFVEASWERCFETYKLAPESRRRIDVLTNAELRETVDRYEDLVAAATAEVDDLFQRLVHGEYIVSLASAEGTKIMFRCDPYRLGELSSSGVLLGALWSEESQGTNGIGTCLKIGQALAIIGEQHFQRSLKSFTCVVAPICSRDGVVEGVLNVSSLQGETMRTASLLTDIVKRSARRIETRLFLQRNRDLARMTSVAFHDHLPPMGDAIELQRGTAGYRDRFSDGQHERLGIGGYGFTFSSGPLPAGAILLQEEIPRARRDRTMIAASTIHKGPGQNRLVPAPDEIFAPPLDPRHGETYATAKRFLSGGQPVVLLGEAGTGKTRFARQLAQWLGNSAHPMMFLSGMTDPGELLAQIDGLRFGVPRGLVIDNAKDLPQEAQRRLVYWLEEMAIQGPVRLPLITVADDDTLLDADRGGLRKELGQRLCGAILRLPPLRNAPALQGIVSRVFELECSELDRRDIALAADTLAALTSYHWPNNMRELRSVMRHAIILARQTVRTTDLPEQLAGLSNRDITANSIFEATRIQSALAYNAGKIAHTARYLGMSRATLYRKIKLHGL